MVKWSDAHEIVKETRILQAYLLVLVGVVTWEVVVTFPFDWEVITGRRKWRWPMVLYFLCRICLVLGIWTLAIQQNALSEVNCQGLFSINEVAAAVGTCASGAILALRAYAVWGKDRKVGIPLLILFLGQLAIWGYVESLWAWAWDPLVVACVPISMRMNGEKLVWAYSYTVAFDTFIIGIMVMRLFRHAKLGGICALLLKDGILYYVASLAANGTEVILAALQLNEVMNVIAIPSVCVVSTIAAQRLFRRPFDSLTSESFGTTGLAVSTIAFRRQDAETLGVVESQGMQTGVAGIVGVTVFNNFDIERGADSKYDEVRPAAHHGTHSEAITRR